MAWLEKRNGTYRVCYRVGRKVKRILAYTDKAASLGMLTRLEKELAKGKEGLTDPYAEHRDRPIVEHLADWVTELRQTGCTPYYASQCEARITRLIEECGWKLLADMKPESFIAWRKNATSNIDHKLKDKSMAKLNFMAPKTQNHYLATLGAFCNWCIERKRMEYNPTADVASVEQSGDVRRKRRALTPDQVTTLLAAVPNEYKLLYRMFLTTGLRRNEAAKLQWGDLHIDGPTPFLQLRAQTTKSKRADALPLRADIAAELKMTRNGAGDADPVFRRVPLITEHCRWLDAAGIPYLDAQGRRLDIHALRHTYGTLLSKAGVSPREAMSLMRHTDMRLTMNVYTDPRIFDLANAVEKLPLPPSQTPTTTPLSATGTDNAIPLPNAIAGQIADGVAQEVARTATHVQCSASNGTHREGRTPQDLSGKIANRHSNAPIDINGERGIRTLGGLNIHTRFPVAFLKPLGHLSNSRDSGIEQTSSLPQSRAHGNSFS